ncbi:uncharacterized protein ARMOST_17676 [Armillaria ostoyae]|uniref:Uncharacterized protein n=1 Tax=Armillaria ostoyae TaxID=47428 RepID=A0A284RZQ3_ARMOS|nr:uncharacterized protein ARMOST_17676 [Armillaria ostoyae]
MSHSTADDVLTRETAHLNPKSEIVVMSELFESLRDCFEGPEQPLGFPQTMPQMPLLVT